MDGLSAAAAIVSIVEIGGPVIKTLVEYGETVGTANKSRQRIIREIEMINSLGRAAEAYAQNLSTNPVPECFYRLWTDPGSPSMLYKGQLEIFRKELSEWQRTGRVKTVKAVVSRFKWPAKKSKMETAIESFGQYISEMNLAVTLQNADVSNAILRQGEQQLSFHQDVRHSDELEKMYVWMDAINCTTKYQTTLSQRQDETCTWLLGSNRYTSWCTSENPFLWLHGKAGTGKSVLISAVIENLLNTESNSMVAYFYCDFRTKRSTHAFEVIRSLLTQLLVGSKQDWLPSFQDLVKCKSNLEPPAVDLEILFQLLLKALSLHDNPVLVIDALDECNDYAKLTELLARLPNEASCRVFTTSRPLPHAQKTFRGLPTIDLHDMSAETQRDMELHVEKEADGMFRWAQYQLDRLSDCHTTTDVHEVLATFPSRLRQTYDGILSDINEKEFDGKVVKSALIWLVGALKPLSLRALAEAVTFDMQDRLLPGEDILDICRELVSYDETDDVVSLSHFSMKEYLFDEHLCVGAHSQYHLSSTIANNHLAKLYIDYIRTSQISQHHEIGGMPRSSVKTLQDYMENFGRDHLSRAAETEEPPH
ncbi:hypothetical protein BU15DRAFT_82041 [Melanogaster broomeanus]|nr:hypothetical protein BU15DRAFT_82041 [Melanogaster broomeanus]